MKKFINILVAFSLLCSLTTLDAKGKKKKKSYSKIEKTVENENCCSGPDIAIIGFLIAAIYIQTLQPANGYYYPFCDTSCNPSDYQQQFKILEKNKLNAIEKFKNDPDWPLCEYIGEECNSCPFIVCGGKTSTILTDNYMCPETTAKMTTAGRYLLGDSISNYYPTQLKNIHLLKLTKNLPTKSIKHNGRP